jgi:hypothetical protein
MALLKNNEKFRFEKNPQVALQIAQNRMSASWNYPFTRITVMIKDRRLNLVPGKDSCNNRATSTKRNPKNHISFVRVEPVRPQNWSLDHHLI